MNIEITYKGRAMLQVAALVALVADLLSHRVGELPTQGWLRDNDQSRLALSKLAALAAMGPPMSELPDSHPAEATGVIATLSKDERAALYAKYTQLLRDEASRATPSGWQDIATAPRDGTQILLYAAGGQQGVGEWREVCKRSGGWLTGDHGSALIFLTEVATHWMPLPEPPK